MTALSQERSVNANNDSTCYSLEEKKIIANTFLENNYLHQQLDSCESLSLEYKAQLESYKTLTDQNTGKINLLTESVETQGIAINNLSRTLKQQAKDLNKAKLTTSIIVGGVSVAVGVELIHIILPYLH